jgi:hypothetical protein
VSSLVETTETPPDLAVAEGAGNHTLRLAPTGMAARRRHGLGLLMALATLGLLTWRLSGPALWLDESASAVATQRTWPNLWLMLRGSDAPLVPYYALLKVLTTATTDLFPQAASHPEVLFRWPSVVAAVLGVWLLTVWLARFSSGPVVLGTGVFLLASLGLSRYGQEARPYAFVLLAAIACTVAWTRMIDDGRARRLLLYALTVVVLIAANSLAAVLVAAHLVAALTAPEPGRRRSAVRRTVVGAGLGGLVVSPLAANAVLHGGGATRFPPLDPDNLGTAFLHLFTSGTHPVLWMGALLPFSVLGLTRVTSPAYRFVARIAAAWALVPPAVLLPAVMVRPNLLLGRYLMFVVPAWAVLGGLGVATVFELLTRLARFRTVAGLLTVALLGAAVWTQIPALVQVRWPGGHGEDIRPALAAANSSQYLHLPMYVFGRYGAVEIGAYDRRYERRMIGMLEQRTLRSIWPAADPVAVRSQQLRLAPELVLLMRTSSAKANCTDVTMERTSKDVVRCMPAPLRSRHYRVLSFRREGRNWTFALLRRPTPTSPSTAISAAAALTAAARQIVKA